MAQSATLAGLAISQSKTAIAHSLSYSVTAHFGVPHGLACSFTLPELLRQNRALVVALTRQPEMIERLSRFLQTVDLASHVRRYVSSEGLLALREETLNADRIGNYEGTLECAPFEIITRSMS
jgi:alcohol dehydrogenase